MLHWNPQDESAQATALAIEEDVRARLIDMPVVQRRPGVLIATRATTQIVGKNYLVIGSLFPRGPVADVGVGEDGAAAKAAFERFCRGLVRDRWGSYTVFHCDEAFPSAVSVFRDPIGTQECATWTHHGVKLVASHASAWLERFPPPAFALDWAAVTAVVGHADRLMESVFFTGIHSVEPGTIVQLGQDIVEGPRLWTPRQFCVTHGQGQSDPGALRQCVDDCVEAWSNAYNVAAVELSGGLDSALVAASLTAYGGLSVHGFTFHGDDLAGDERRFSRVAAAQLTLACDEIALVPRSLTAADVEDMPADVRPGIGSTTLFHDRLLAGLAVEKGSKALFTGRGGDAVFFQHPTPLVAAEALPGGARAKLQRIGPLARWSQQSVWRVLACVSGFGFGDEGRAPTSQSFARRPVPSTASRWAGDLSGLPAAKRMQILAIAGDRAAFGSSWCSARMPVIHPLLSQPLVEHVLGISTMMLTDGRRDRALARAAFADRLPEDLIARRGKGSLTCFFGRTLARSVPFLRDHLLGGALAEAGVLDIAALEVTLKRDYLMQHDCYASLLSLVVIEQWARTWRSRIDHLGLAGSGSFAASAA